MRYIFCFLHQCDHILIYQINLNDKEYFSNIFYQKLCRNLPTCNQHRVQDAVYCTVLLNLRSTWGQHAALARSPPDPAPLSMRKGNAEVAFECYVYILNFSPFVGSSFGL